MGGQSVSYRGRALQFVTTKFIAGRSDVDAIKLRGINNKRKMQGKAEAT